MASRTGGHPALILPSNTSEFQALVDALRGHHSTMHGQLTDIAAYLMGVLPGVIKERGGTHAALIGLDARHSAKQIIKPLMEVAAANERISRAYILSYLRYQERVVNISPNSGARPKFNVNG